MLSIKSDQIQNKKKNKVPRDHTVKLKYFHIHCEWHQLYKKDTHIYIYKPHTHQNVSTATIYNNTYKDQHPIHHSKKCTSSK